MLPVLRMAPKHDLPQAHQYHTPVLCRETVGLLCDPLSDPDQPPLLLVDGTLGAGGHTAEMLARTRTVDRVIGFDQDEDAIRTASDRLSDAVEVGRLSIIHANTVDMASALAKRGITAIDGLLLDLGVSSWQLDADARGFTFRADAPLDMRMDQQADETAADLLARLSEPEIAQLIYRYGEEPASRKIARAIITKGPITTTTALVEAVRSAVPPRNDHKVLARVFQALRIAVNHELDVLESILTQATRLVRPGGTISILSYHSLEDRRVKRYLRQGSVTEEAPRDLYGNRLIPWVESTRKPICASEDEVRLNPRARSARLRGGIRTEFALP